MSNTIAALQLMPFTLDESMLKPALLKRTRALMERATSAGLPLRYLGAMPLFDKHRVYHGETTDWVVMNLAQDPLMDDRDGFPVPAENLEQLWAVHCAGIEFSGLYIAHEVAAGSVQQDKRIRRRDVAPPAPRAVVKQSAQMGKASNALWTIAMPFVEPRTAIEGAKQVAIALEKVDPVLFGVVIAPRQKFKEGQDATWFYIGNWTFDNAE